MGRFLAHNSKIGADRGKPLGQHFLCLAVGDCDEIVLGFLDHIFIAQVLKTRQDCCCSHIAHQIMHLFVHSVAHER